MANRKACSSGISTCRWTGTSQNVLGEHYRYSGCKSRLPRLATRNPPDQPIQHTLDLNALEGATTRFTPSVATLAGPIMNALIRQRIDEVTLVRSWAAGRPRCVLWGNLDLDLFKEQIRFIPAGLPKDKPSLPISRRRVNHRPFTISTQQ